MQNTWSCSSLVLNKNKMRENLSEGLKVRLASGLAQAVNFILGIYAEPPLDCMVGLRSIWEKLYMYIYIYTTYVYIYM